MQHGAEHPSASRRQPNVPHSGVPSLKAELSLHHHPDSSDVIKSGPGRRATRHSEDFSAWLSIPIGIKAIFAQ
jgi:hypothetical protein